MMVTFSVFSITLISTSKEAQNLGDLPVHTGPFETLLKLKKNDLDSYKRILQGLFVE